MQLGQYSDAEYLQSAAMTTYAVLKTVLESAVNITDVLPSIGDENLNSEASRRYRLGNTQIPRKQCLPERGLISSAIVPWKRREKTIESYHYRSPDKKGFLSERNPRPSIKNRKFAFYRNNLR